VLPGGLPALAIERSQEFVRPTSMLCFALAAAKPTRHL
jgi:hypothetical protein